MNELFDFGSRPIRVIENNNRFQFVHNKEGWIIADAQPTLDHRGDEAFTIQDGEGEFKGTVITYANLATLVSQIYDQEYGPDATPIKPDQIWVVFAEESDGEQSATFSRESLAPDLETAKDRFLSEVTHVADFPPNDVTIITIYGPYMRA